MNSSKPLTIMTQEVYNTLSAEERELVDEFGIENVEDDVEFITCDRCGCKMIADTEEHYTNTGCLCDCCYDDMYG